MKGLELIIVLAVAPIALLFVLAWLVARKPLPTFGDNYPEEPHRCDAPPLP